MKSFQRLRLALALALFAAYSAPAAITVLDYWHMGENDTQAVSGGQCTNTLDTVGGNTLAIMAAGGLYPTYTNDVSATASLDSGSTLALAMTIGQYGTARAATSAVNNFGIECWVKPGASIGDYVLVLNGIRSTGWGLYLAGTNFEVIYGGRAFFESVPASTNVWTHLALVRNGGVATFYTNGVQAGTNFSAAPLVPSGSLTVGGDAIYANEGFTGLIDEVRVFTFTAGQFSTNDLLLNSRFVSNINDTGAGSLRDVVANAPNNALITFAPNLSGQTISFSGPISLANNAVIDASALANGLTLQGNQNRIFQTASGSTNTLKALTITGGSTSDTSVGGGAILNGGSLTLTGCTLYGNSATGGFNNPNGGPGGAISTSGTLNLNDCTLALNSSGGGGAIYNSGTLALTQCTVSSNSVKGTGGGIFDGTGGSMTLDNTIVAGNSTTSGAGLDIEGVNCTNAFVGTNIIQSFDSYNSLNTGTTAINANPLLGPLGNYGGPTLTMRPLLGSPAINAGTPTTLTIDQRGFPRPVGPAPDIGAVEFQYGLVVSNTTDAGENSLRAAVQYDPSGSKITFAPGLSGQTILLTNGQMTIAANLTIDASASPGGVVVSGNNQSRIFNIMAQGAFTLTGLTMINANGGGADGGALLNAGNTVLNYCTFTGNATGSGGAIKNTSGSLVLNECTLYGNSTLGGGGGGIVNYATLFLNGCTLTGNSAGFYGGAVYSETGAQVTLNDTIAAGNTANDIYTYGTLTLSGSNIVQFITGISSGTTPINASPQLAAPGYYGGPTPTMPPLPGSPAIDAGDDSEINFLPLDQRGYPRLAGAHVDIGAVEGIYNAVGPGKIKSITHLGNGSVQLSFTNVTDAVFPVLATSNLNLPLSSWTQIGFTTESPVGSGQFPFTDTQATNYPQRYYSIRSP